MPGTNDDPRPLTRVLDAITPVSAEAVGAADQRQAQLTKPRGSLGELEALGSRLAGVYGECPPPLPEPVAVAVFAADHGVHAQGVTPWPQEVTVQMVANLLDGGAVVNAFGRQAGARVTVVDVGVAGEVPAHPDLLERAVAAGTADMTQGPAMTPEQTLRAVSVGIEVAESLVAQGVRLLVTGDMGIANTTASAALVSALTGAAPEDVTGRGTGIDEVMLAHKVDVVRRALRVNGLGIESGPARPGAAGRADPLGVLAAVGGFEHAAVAGYLLAAAAHRTPVLLDGVIACSAALVAAELAPEATGYWIAGHRSAEPGATAALDQLGLHPLVDLGMRLGEGSGAALAIPLVQAAARVLREVATFDSAGVTDKDGFA